ncbi:hypothetical protein MMC30_000840 [Trapelia coarctata]|nr:hypothetical protein [Trapelia coarctata]
MPRGLCQHSIVKTYHSPPQHQRSDSTAYFTALWGSPYEVSSSSIDQLRGHRHERSNSTITADGSPLRSLRKGKSHEPFSTLDRSDQAATSHPPADSNAAQTAGPGLTAARSDGSLRKPRYGFTQDWLRTHLAGRKNSEKGNWWSDDSGNSDTEIGATKVATAQEDASEPWFDSDRSEGHESIQSPARHPQEVNVRESSLHSQKRTVYHRALPSDETIKQKDFDEIFGRNRQAKLDNTMLQSIHAVPEVARPPARSPTAAEKPLPPPPVNRTVSEAPVSTSPAGLTESPVNAKRPSISGSMPFQRPRKRVVWRGKTCVIALPIDDGTSSPKQYLSLQDRKARLAEWEANGFSVRGFELVERNDGGFLPHGQSRDIYPDPRIWQQEWQERKYRVSIPDKKAWDDYVNHLKEEKLRALGVSFGDEEPPSRNSPALSSLSRQTSAQNVILPPLSATTMSASSSRSQMGHSMSPSMAQNPFGRPPSLVSSAPQQYNPGPGSSHFPKQSVSFQNGQPYGHLAHFPMQQAVPPGPGGWAQQYFSPQTGSRGVSPLVNGLGQTLRATQSPVSPLAGMANDGFISEQVIAQRRMTLPNNVAQSLQHVPRQQPSPNQHLGAPLIAPNARPQNHPDEVHPNMYISQPEIASPLPQGHRQNPSESLQREIDSAEYHLEESIRRQLDEEDELSLTSATNDEGPFHGSFTSANGVQSSLAGTLQKPRAAMSDLDTNPSLANTPSPTEKESKQAASVSAKPSHAPKASVSKLNVNAREFVFDPSKSFAPSAFTFSGNTPAFNPAPTPKAQVAEVKPLPKTNGTTFSKGLNVAAPAFTPGAFSKLVVPSSEFSFSSAMPTLKPDAPTFTPGAAAFHTTSGSDWSGSDKPPLPRIFNNFDFSQAPTGGKKSKAIPIVKPQDVSATDKRDSDSDGQEDEFGRITQAEGRQKRARRADDDGDSVPLFATPGPDVSREQSAALDMTPRKHSQKESTSMDELISGDDEDQKSPAEKATGQLKDLLDDLVASGESSSEEDLGPAETDDKDLEPFEFKDAAEAANFDLARPRSSSSTKSKVSEYKEADIEPLDQPSEHEKKDLSADKREEDNKVSLSATVQPYEYNPDLVNFQLGLDVKPHSSAFVSGGGLGASRYASGDLGASRYAPKIASPEVSSPSLTAEILRAEDSPPLARAPSVEQAESPDSEYLNPTYQEIDAVMKHLNEDSDAGVERIRPIEVRHSPIPSPVRSVILSPIPVYEDLSERDQRLSAAQRKIPSASPNRLQQPFQYLPQREFGSSDSAAAELVQRNARYSPSYKPPRYNAIPLDSSVHRLHGKANLPISDWDDAVSSGEEAKFHSRSNFFDHKVNDLIGAVVQQRLQPLEKNLLEMNSSLSRLLVRSESRRNRRSMSAEIEKSDADDEDDDEEVSQARARSQARSPLKDRKYDRLKASLLETLSTQRQPAPMEESSRILEALAELKDSVQQQKPIPSVDTKSSSAADIKSIVEEAVAKQMRGKSAPITSSASSATAEKYQLQIAGLESMLKVAESRAEDELKARRQAEDALADHQRLLRNAQAEASEQRESAEETERSLRTFHEERLQAAQRTSLMEAAQMDFKRTIMELSEKNSALEDTLEEYRLSSAQWREEIDEAKSDNRNLDRTIHALKSELEDGIRGRRILKTKLDKLQEEMTTAARNVARDQSLWRRREEEHKARHELQSARLEAEARTRERFQLEIERLESQEKEAMKSRFLVDQVQGENGRLVAMVNDLKSENDRVHKDVLRYQRDLHDVKETGRLDIQRVQMAMEADMEKANHETQIVRRDLESVIARLQTQLGDARADAAAIKEKYEHTIEETKAGVASFKSKYEALLEDAKADAAAERSKYESLLESAKAEAEAVKARSKIMLEEAKSEGVAVKSRYEFMLEEAKSEAVTVRSRYEVMLEEASESRDNALREAAEAREAALQDHYRFHERTMEEMKGMHDRAMVAAREDRDRALKMVFEDRQAVENNLKARLELEVDKAAHYQDRVTHLEEKLEITKAAAQAAAQAAQSARASPTPTALAATVVSRGSDVGGKISPQALRESILVLQEQLHERESQIERLQQELADVDKEAPTKIKERDIEISWLRELLGVRIDDLQDIITTLSQPTYNREAVKDAAIRLKANLQMEQQEKERAIAGGQSFPSLASITNLTVSPRALPFAAAAALGNWGKGRFGSLAEMANGSANNTPSKSSPASMFSGLLTPPSTTLRQTPQPLSSRKGSLLSSSSNRPLRGYQQTTPRQSISRQLSNEAPPETPRLLRHASYDNDAESGHYSLDRYTREREDDDSTVDGHVAPGGDDGMFGPTIGS